LEFNGIPHIFVPDRPEGENVALAQGIIGIMEVESRGILGFSREYNNFAEFIGNPARFLKFLKESV